MRPVAMRVRALLRAGWVGSLAVAVVVAATVAVVVALAAGARRTGSAPDRFTRAVGGNASLLLVQPAGDPVTEQVQALPGVREVANLTFIGLEALAHDDEGPDLNTFAGIGFGPSTRVVEGREPDANRPEEFVANASAVEALQLRVGETSDFQAYTKDQLANEGINITPPRGELIHGRLVGVVFNAPDLEDPTPSVIFSPALLSHDVAVVATIMPVYLDAGTTPDAFRQELSGIEGHEGFFFQDGRVVSPASRAAVRAQALGLGIITAVVGLVGLAVMAQVVLRHVRSASSDRVPLHALGYTHAQQVAEDVGRAAVPVVAGSVVGAMIGALASGLFPRGFVRQLEPHPGGLDVDRTVVVVGAGAAMVVLLACVALATSQLGRRRRPAPTSSGREAVLRRVPDPAVATGIRFSFARRQRDGTPVAITASTLVLALTSLFAAAVFSSSLQRVVTDEGRFGMNFSHTIGAGFTIPLTDGAVAAIDADPAVESFVRMGATSTHVEGQDVDLLAVQPERGGLTPRVLEGRFPDTDDEVALGRVTARRLGVGVEGTVAFDSEGGDPIEYRVVGLAVIPNISFAVGGGHGAAMLADGVARLQPDLTTDVVGLNLRRGATLTPAVASLRPQRVETTTIPPDVVTLRRARSAPAALIPVLGLLTLLSLVHALLTSLRWRRRDLAVLRALGAGRAFITRAVHAQATTLAVLTIVVGAPLGAVTGRLIFRYVADRFGLVPTPLTPPIVVVAVVVGVLVVANLAALVPARRARHAEVARLLSQE